jgi:hypothetical protein
LRRSPVVWPLPVIGFPPGMSGAGPLCAQVLAVAAAQKHVQSIKLELPPSASDHRRMLAVLAYLQQTE